MSDPAGGDAAARKGRRELAAAFAVTAVGGGLLALAASRPVGSADAPSLTGTPDTTVGGPGATAVGVLGLAAAVAVLAVRGWLRVAVGVLVAGLGLGVVAVRATSGGGAGSAVWSWLIVVGALLLAGGGLLSAVRGRSWPGMSARYERAGTPAAPRPSDPKSLWDALDRGEDPTDRPA
jgi:hypothetical protein